MSEKLSLSALARALGVAKRSVQYYEQKNVITKGEDGLFDLDECRANIAKKIHQGYNMRHKKQVTVTEDDQKGSLDFNKARTLREVYEAKMAALKFQEMEKSVVDRAMIEKLLFERARQCRDILMACSRRVAPEIAAITDIKQVEQILEREHRNALEQFAKLPIVE